MKEESYMWVCIYVYIYSYTNIIMMKCFSLTSLQLNYACAFWWRVFSKGNSISGTEVRLLLILCSSRFFLSLLLCLNVTFSYQIQIFLPLTSPSTEQWDYSGSASSVSLSPLSKSVVLHQGWLCTPRVLGNIWTYFGLTQLGKACYWQPVVGGQECC